MHKHSDLTRRRIEQFLNITLKPALLGSRTPLEVEFCDVPHHDSKAAQAGPWRKVEPGFQYGPAYTTFWFRLSGRVPAEWNGRLALEAQVGGERTLWGPDHSPARGIDGPHDLVLLAESTEPGQAVQFVVQVYTGNPECRVHVRELPREPLVAKLERADLVEVDVELRDLFYDVLFTLNLYDTLPETEPVASSLLRALNEVCNRWAADGRSSVARSRRILKEVLGSHGGEVQHTITPVGHAHLDTAWLWPLEITHKKMAHTTATQLDLVERYPEYVFVHSQASQYEWLEDEYPKLFERVKEAVAGGRWEPVGSMWVEADCNLTGAESLVRQFLYGRRYFREKFGFETEDMWLPDVFGYSAAIPQILAKFGIKAFMTQKISWNQFNRFPHNTFFWQGIDGTRIWSHFPPADTYTGDATPKQILSSVRNHRDKARCDRSLYVFGHGDGGGGPTEEHLELLRRARIAPCMPEIESAKTAKQFFREARAASRDLQTWVGELYFELHRGTYTSQAKTKANNRSCEFLLRDAEYLACFRDDYPDGYPAEALERAWKLVLLNQFHDIIPGSSVNEVYRDADRDYDIVRSLADPIVEQSLKRIGAKFDTSRMRQPIAVFQNADVRAEGQIPWTESEPPASLATADESLPVQIVEFAGERSLIFPTPTSALGSVTVADLSDQPSATKYRLKASSGLRRLENDELTLRFDAHGNITSIQSLHDGTEFVEQGRQANLFQLFDDKPLFWSAWDVDAFMLETAKDLVRSDSFEIVERGPVRVAAELVKTFGSSTIRQRISLGPTPGIRFDTWIDWHESDKMLKVAFPVNVNATRGTFEIQFGNVERPTHRNTTWDLARFEVCQQKWFDLSEGDHGVALLNDGKYGCDVLGNVMRLSLLRSPKAPDPECDMGVHRFTYVLFPHFGPYNLAGVVQAAYAVNAPVRTAFLNQQDGIAAAIDPFVTCDDRNLVIEAVKKAEDSNALIVRMYECHNARGRAELACLRSVNRAFLCDLEENPIEELEVEEGAVRFEYRPFEIITIRLDV